MLKKDITRQELARIMVGREIPKVLSRRCVMSEENVLELTGIKALNDRGMEALSGLSVCVRKGEILGIAGVAGNGQKELVEVIAGLRPTLAGSMKINGKNLTNCKPGDIINAGVAIVPEDRVGMGLAQNFNVIENLIVKTYRDSENSRRGFLNWKHLRKNAEKIVKDFDIKTAGVFSPVKLMSGGNQQKLLFARETSKKPSLLVAAYPCRGLDLGATHAVHQILLSQKEQGTGILLISEDLDELLNLADRIAVIYEGKITGIVVPGKASIEQIGLMMCGGGKECIS